MMISWGAASQEDCSCSVRPGVWSVGPNSQKDLITVHQQTKGFHLAKKNGQSFQVQKELCQLLPVEKTNHNWSNANDLIKKRKKKAANQHTNCYKTSD